MDDSLYQRLEKIEASIDSLKKVELQYLMLEANRKPLFSQLFLHAPGKNNAEKEAHAYDSKDWRDFSAGLVGAESALNHERRRYEMRLKAYDAEHLTFKNQGPAIRRPGGAA